MTTENKFKVGLALQEIALSMDDATLERNRERIKLIEDIIAGEQERKTVSIPEGATNGDVFQIMFNKTFPKTIILYKHDESRLMINPMFSREWWEMPYKESEEKA